MSINVENTLIEIINMFFCEIWIFIFRQREEYPLMCQTVGVLGGVVSCICNEYKSRFSHTNLSSVD